jgi:tetratricopeptide (TPR) repeat protein/MinD-like ATPase involved in chromosome partitioning or flagellar assembly
MADTSSSGKIITFYSYKGGTGRSMALANVAWILASNGKRVLALDWDLEAPGLHTYFHPFLMDKGLTDSDGVIDFVIDFSIEAMTPSETDVQVSDGEEWYTPQANILRYAAALDWDFGNGGVLDFVPAGRQGLSYSTRVNSFDWQDFYDRLGGGVFIETAKEKMRETYDYILIDSRTGVSDTSGICTVQMPDVLVVCFTLNNQSIEGAAAVANSVHEQRQESGPQVQVFPVPMRIENAEQEKLNLRWEQAKRKFASFPAHMLPETREQYLREVAIPYVPFYAYEEILAVFGERHRITNSLLAQVEKLTTYLIQGSVKQAHIEESQREKILAQYEGKVAVGPSAKPFNVPPRTPFFTGREQVLRQLHASLTNGGTQAIYGLGGIGKTHTAIEYAHRHRDDYRAVLWVNAGTRDALVSDFVAIARLLDLPERDVQDRNLIVGSVRRWMETNDDWLLIFDSADEPRLIQPFLPRNPEGRILLMSRTQVFQSLGISRPFLLGVMTPEEALEFLFRRTGRSNDDPAERKAAEELARELDCLPLALEQAGAYITARQTRFRDYLASYHKRRLRLLESSSSAAGDPLPESVVTTWTISFREVKEASEAAADLLRLSAFLGPDHIPLELIVTGAADLGPALSSSLADASDDPLVVDEVLEPLTRHSLIRRDVEAQTYSIQRLVQAVLQDSLDEKSQRLWAERAVRALYRTFPTTPKFTNWPLCDRLFPHARACVPFIERWLALTEAGDLLNRAGSYLWARGQFVEAEPMFRQAVQIMEGALGPSDPGTAHTLNNLAVVYEALGRYAEAEALYQQVMAIYEKALGPEHPDVATNLNNLALLYYAQARLSEAEEMFQRAVRLREKVLGPEHPDTAASLNNLANLYTTRGNYAEAEELFQRTLAINQKALGSEHPSTATSLNNLAEIYRVQERYADAEMLYERALAIQEKALGPEHLDVAKSLHNLALLYSAEDRDADAEQLLKRVEEIMEKALGPEHPNMAVVYANHATVLEKLGRNADAEAMTARARAIQTPYGRPAKRGLQTGQAGVQTGPAEAW